MSLEDHLRELQADIAKAYSPPWWRPFLRYRWKRRGARIVGNVLLESVFGETEPRSKLGVWKHK